MKKQMPWEYKNCKIGQVYDMGDEIIGEVTYAWSNGAALFLIKNGPLKGREVPINGQSTSVYRLMQDV